MKHIVYLFLVMTAMSYAQIGVGTAKPHPSSVLDLSLGKKGLLLPRVAKAEDVITSMPNKPNGLVVYDETLKAVRFFENGVWSPPLTSMNPSIASDCAATVLDGTFYSGVALTAANTFKVTITNTSNYDATVAFQPSDLVLSGVAGVTVASVSVPTATIVKTTGTQEIVYTLSGTPTATGTLTATWKKLNLSCTKTINVTNNPAPLPMVLDCLGITHAGSLTDATAASGVSSTIPYTNGNGSTHTGQIVTSTGVTGLTATLAAGSFATGSGTLTYNIGGIPSGNGTASFAINIGGQSCTLTRTVAYVSVPNTITLAQNSDYVIVSVKDDDYKPYSLPLSTEPARTGASDAGGGKESLIEIQGTITTRGDTVKIPVTVTGAGGTLAAYSTTIAIPANLTEDNVSGIKLRLFWNSQTCTTATKFITATIQAVGGVYNAPKLDINAGIGGNYLGLVVADFPIVFNNLRQATIFRVRVLPAHLDKMFGQPDNSGNRNTHLMLYYPIVAEDGKTWLKNRLGADYANTQNTNFNPNQQANASNDHLAYGSLFQWGRKADGHELITWSSGSAGTPVYNTTTPTQSDNPTVTSFITSSSDWRVAQDDLLWQTEASANNPCPKGFRVATDPELTNLFTSAGILNDATAIAKAFASRLKFPVVGFRNFSSGTFSSVGSQGYCWSSSISGISANYRIIYSGGTASFSSHRGLGISVACIKD